MGELFHQIDHSLEEFIRAQKMFFVGTAPLNATGHVNVSPKGLDTLRVLDPQTMAYLDYVGSGAETIAHLRENGRIVLMLCAFQGPPRIVRFHGRGSVFEPPDQEFIRLRGLFPAEPAGRAIVRISIGRIADSCGYGVPLYAFEGNRSQLSDWAARKGPRGLHDYQVKKNRVSIDGLQALRGPETHPSTKPDQPAGSDPLQCSFCRKFQSEVRKLIAGPAVMICDECVAVCVDILAAEVPQAAPKDAVEGQRWRANAAKLSGEADSDSCSLCGKSTFIREMLPIESRGSLCGECADAIEDALDHGRPAS